LGWDGLIFLLFYEIIRSTWLSWVFGNGPRPFMEHTSLRTQSL